MNEDEEKLHVISVIIESDASPSEVVRTLKDAMRLRGLRGYALHETDMLELDRE